MSLYHGKLNIAGLRVRAKIYRDHINRGVLVPFYRGLLEDCERQIKEKEDAYGLRNDVNPSTEKC